MSLAESEPNNVRSPSDPDLLGASHVDPSPPELAGEVATPAVPSLSAESPAPNDSPAGEGAQPSEFEPGHWRAEGAVAPNERAEQAPTSAVPVIAVARTISIGPKPPTAGPPEPDPGAIPDVASAAELARAASADYGAAVAPALDFYAPATFAPAPPAPLPPAAVPPVPEDVPASAYPAHAPHAFAEPATHAPEGNPFISPTEVEGSFERYQRLFAESEKPGVAQNPIVAAIDAAVQSPVLQPGLAPAGQPVPTAQSQFVNPPEQPANIDLERDVDWHEPAKSAAELLGRVAAAIPLADVHPTASSSTRESSRAPSPASARPAPAEPSSEAAFRARQRSKSWVDDEAADSTGPNSAARRKSRKRAGRSRTETSALLIVGFVASVVLALGTGFVAGFLVGRGSPSASQSTTEAATDAEAKLKPADAAQEAPAANDDLEIVKDPSQPAAQAAPSTGAPAAAALAANRPNRASVDQKSPSTFDQKSAGAALSKAQARAGLCVQPGEPGGTAVVTVTFDPSGATSSAAVYGARFSGTSAGECMVKMLRDLKVRPFTGDPVTVKKTISVE